MGFPWDIPGTFFTWCSMFKVISCIAFDHKLDVLALAVLVCVLGVFLTVRLHIRAFRSHNIQKLNWLLMSGIIGGSTIWTAHFIAMLSYRVELVHGYHPMLTLGSLGVAVTTLGLFISTLDKTGPHEGKAARKWETFVSLDDSMNTGL